MATTTTITKLLIRRGNDADRKQTILASGEPGFALDTGRVWIGDGATPGGLPVIAVADHHLHYTDDTGVVEGNFSRHLLDVNMPGLSATMAGDRIQPNHAQHGKMFHPADRTLVSNYPIEINRDGSGNDLAFTGSEGDEFKITRTTPGVINIADVLKITIPENGGKPSISIDVQDGDFVLAAEGQKFAEGNDTLFEDKSTDYNVPMLATGEQLFPGTDGAAEAATVENTGIYFAHMGVLSAGAFKVGGTKDFTGFNTLQLKPAVYKKDWTADYVNLETRLDGTITVGDTLADDVTPGKPPLPRWQHNGTSSWQGPIRLTADNGVSPMFDNKPQFTTKPINIRSVRPADSASDNYKSGHERSRENCWAGDIDVILESGLLVYGPGDPDIQDPANPSAGLNGYLINQSVDSLAIPTFQGLRIEGPNAKPLNVKSGGTGRNSFDPNRLLMSHESDREGNLREFSLSQGKAIIGTTSGTPVQGGIEVGEESVYWTTAHNNNRLKFNSTFLPTDTTAPGGYHNVTNAVQNVKDMFFDKFSYFSGDAGNAGFVPTRFDSKVKFTGDTNNLTTDAAPQGGSSSGAGPLNGAWDPSPTRRPGNTIAINHVEHAVAGGAFAKGSGSGDQVTITAGTGGLAATADTRNDGRVLTSITLNKGGHVRDLQSRNLDTRYAQLAHMGTTNTRSGGSLAAPADLNLVIGVVGAHPLNLASTNTAKGWLENANDAATGHAQVISSIDFNDYGTVKNVTLTNLNYTYYNRAEVVKIVDRIAAKIDAIDVRLDNDFLFRTKQSNTSSSASSTSWLYGTKVGFGSSSSMNSYINENSSEFEFISNKQIDFDTTKNFDFNINGKNSLYMEQNHQYFYSNGSATVKFDSTGITLQGSNKRFKGGIADQAEDAQFLNFKEVGSHVNNSNSMENDPEHTYYPTFVELRGQTGGTTGYRQALFDNDLHYNPKHNYFGGAKVKFIGDGEGLDMSKNASIPSSIELETASPNLYYNLVMSDNNSRENIYDKPNMGVLHSTAGHLLTRGDVIAFWDFSDERLKENITTLDSKDSLDKVLKLNAVSYNWIIPEGDNTYNPHPGTQIGLIAQEVEKVVPEVVTESARITDTETQYKRIDYEHLVPLLVESIKELNKKVEDLESKLAEK